MVNRIPRVGLATLMVWSREAASSSIGLLLRMPWLICGSLRAKFIVGMVSLQLIVMGTVAVVMEHRQRGAILEQTRLRALSLGTSLAALSESYLLNYDFIHLEQVVEGVTGGQEDIVYTIAHLYDGRVAAFSGRDDLQGVFLDDRVSRQALQAAGPLVQDIILPGEQDPAYDVAVPVFAPQSSRKWGTMRVGFSLKRAYALIEQIRRDLLLLSLAAILAATSLATVLAMLISKPIGHLVADVQAFAKGAYDHPIQVQAPDEIGYLARAFEQMRIAIQRHLASLADEARRLEEANRRLQETQQQLIQHERLAAVGKIAARVAHEVNNPLAIIKTTLRIMRNPSRGDRPAAEDLQMIEEEINRIARILQDLLSASRPAPSHEVVEVNAILESLQSLLMQDLHEKQIALSLELAPVLPRVRISADQLKQVILNIVRNAADAMPQGGELKIRTACQGQEVEISLTDTGYGIQPEHLSHLFDPFFTTKAGGRGVGLGLAVSEGIIRNAHGRIEVQSEVGKGSTFRVTLPAMPGHQGGASHA